MTWHYFVIAAYIHHISHLHFQTGDGELISGQSMDAYSQCNFKDLVFEKTCSLMQISLSFCKLCSCWWDSPWPLTNCLTKKREKRILHRKGGKGNRSSGNLCLRFGNCVLKWNNSEGFLW